MAAPEAAAGESRKQENRKKKSKRNVENGTDPEDLARVEQEGKKKKKKRKENAVNGEAEQATDVEENEDHNAQRKKKKQKKAKETSPAEGNADENKEVRAETQEDGNRKEVTVSGGDSLNPKYRPLTKFSDVQVPKDVLQCCEKFDKPSPIQAHSWPFLLDGRDLIGIAATGSGKTLAFGLPAVMHVLKNENKPRPRCLVLSPTRELAQQIAVVLEEAGSSSGVKVACLYGGASKGSQKKALRQSPAILVATPGRLQDFIDEGACDLQHVTYLVLDEADRMLDLGFEPAVRAIASRLAKKRQTIMFSATWPIAVEQLAKEFIQEPDPVQITIGSQELTANHDVTQIVEVVDDKARDERLQSLLRSYHKSRKNRILIFVLYKKEAARVERVLENKGWKVKAVHGDKSQEARNDAIAAFKQGTHPLLVATDVAARGLDIPDVEYVINYSFPLTTEDYVHRIGRTGRAGKKGIAHTFFTTSDKARSGELVNILREAGQPVPEDLLKFGTHVKKKESKLYGAHFKELGPDAPKAQKIVFHSDDDE